MRAPNLERRARRRGIVGAAAALGPLLASLLAAGCGGGGGPADPCEPNPCVGLHKTSCLEVDGAARCMCEAGYVESATGDCVSAGGCDPNPCREEHRTRCESPDGAVVCLCDPGYVDGPGGACVPDPCLPNPCAEPNRTRCSAELGVAVCRCDAGWEEGPGGTCVPDDPCLPNPCAEAHRTRCVADGQAVSCLCDDGYVEGGQGECVRPCDLQPCQTPPRTRCANRGESAVCLCDEGMLETEQGVCVDDVCEPNPCAEPRRTACVRQGQTHVCACDPGYALQGAACQRAAANLCSAGGWCLENPLPSVDGLHGVWAHDAHNALAVGEAGRILHHDGTDCVALDAGTWLDVLAVDGRSLSDVWAVGQDGMVLHYDGERWLSVTPTVDPPIRSALRAVWAADAQHVHVAGDDGVWLFLDGESWSRFDTGISQGAIHNLGGSGPYDVWATSDFGRFLHYDGEAVQVHLLVENENLYGLFVEGPEALVVSTSNGRLVRWDGASFEFMTESAGMSGVLLTSVWGDGLGGYYTTGFDILGGRGTILRWDGHAWEEVWAESLGFVWDVDGWPGQAALAVGLGGLLVRDAPGEDAELLVQGTRKDLRAAA
ncbi:MAG TPA: hypothetical protein P5076_24200, partial [Myxococcota bacterium]|nr:hypothetical protein [Myxococcota bacterium]